MLIPINMPDDDSLFVWQWKHQQQHQQQQGKQIAVPVCSIIDYLFALFVVDSSPGAADCFKMFTAATGKVSFFFMISMMM